MDFRKDNTKRVNDIRGFCMQLPQWTRTIRSCLKNWRYQMRWEQPDGIWLRCLSGLVLAIVAMLHVTRESRSST
jgi:hypothetical protein